MHLMAVLWHKPHSIHSASHLTITLMKVNARPPEAKTNSAHRTIDTVPPCLRAFCGLDSRRRQGQALWGEGLCPQPQRRCPRSTSDPTANTSTARSFL